MFFANFYSNTVLIAKNRNTYRNKVKYSKKYHARFKFLRSLYLTLNQSKTILQMSINISEM